MPWILRVISIWKNINLTGSVSGHCVRVVAPTEFCLLLFRLFATEERDLLLGAGGHSDALRREEAHRPGCQDSEARRRRWDLHRSTGPVRQEVPRVCRENHCWIVTRDLCVKRCAVCWIVSFPMMPFFTAGCSSDSILNLELGSDIFIVSRRLQWWGLRGGMSACCTAYAFGCRVHRDSTVSCQSAARYLHHQITPSSSVVTFVKNTCRQDQITPLVDACFNTCWCSRCWNAWLSAVSLLPNTMNHDCRFQQWKYLIWISSICSGWVLELYHFIPFTSVQFSFFILMIVMQSLQ